MWVLDAWCLGAAGERRDGLESGLAQARYKAKRMQTADLDRSAVLPLVLANSPG